MLVDREVNDKMKTATIYCRVADKGSPRGAKPLSRTSSPLLIMGKGSPRGAKPLSIKSFPFPYHKGKGIKGIGSPNKNLNR